MFNPWLKAMRADRRIFLKQLGLGAVGLSLASSWPDCFAADIAVGKKLPRSTPEAQGVSSAKILDFLEAVGKSQHEFHSFMMVRHGHVIAEGWWSPYAPDLNHMLYSLSKSFTSTAIGFAVTEGRLKVDDPVISFFPNDLPDSISENLAALKVKHLLTMSVGHAEDSTPIITKTENWVKSFLALPIANPPGSTFLYNSGATYMLSAIIQKLTGQKVIDYLRFRLFQPLAIEGMTWETCPRGINTGGWGLAIQTEGLAKFGQLYLQKGAWNDKQILPAAWIEAATTFKIQQPADAGKDLKELKKTSDWHQGYCYQFWRCRHKAFRGDGAFGQFTIVMPDQDTVICITSETANMGTEMDLIWEYLLPAMKGTVLPPDPVALARLKQKLSSLALLPPKVQATSPVASGISGKSFKIGNDAKVQSVSFKFQKNACTFTLKDAQGEHPITCGTEKWVFGKTDMPGTPPKLTVGALGPVSKVMASGTWKDANTFVMTWHFYETPHHDTVTCRFDGDKVIIEFLNSVTEYMPSHQETRPALLGQIAG
jgi:CubicO group peptidase (beta-lactamase class C family)